MLLPSLLLLPLSPSLLLLSPHLWPSLTSSRRAALAFEHISPSHTSGLRSDLVLSSKLVVYDMENQTIGWTEYNCSSSIKIKDEKSGAVYSVGAHNISLSFSLTTRRFLTYLSVLFAMLQTCYYLLCCKYATLFGFQSSLLKGKSYFKSSTNHCPMSLASEVYSHIMA
ncbi:hypothetical protein Dsin_028399 [Dipteronia sinensis]|uniref:Peptidase A1 domain-containing protein n=1 Tax=Dipteronia sinensis TaxID=43782 RepID=A0AAD9ZQM0_9ROSI|nr:hypothetical protein Dsin_028399 [Dipteronia sinensis]